MGSLRTDPDATLEFLDADGIVRGWMDLYGERGTITVLTEPQRDVSLAGVKEGGAVVISLERVQLLEGRRYDYVIRESAPGFALDHDSHPCLVPHRADDTRGHLDPGTYTGRLQLQLRRGADDVAVARVEVQSAKVGSLRHYVTMVEDIAERCTELLMQVSSPTQARFESFGEEDAQTLTQRFFFLEALLAKRSFQDAIEKVVRNPHTRSAGVFVERRLARGGFPMRAGELRQMASRRPRRELPSGHPLRDLLPSLPETVTTREHMDFADIPENRFVKHALRTFVLALETLASGLRRGARNQASEHVAGRAEGLAAMLGEHLSHSFFRQLSDPSSMPLGSPVLQRREGYREVLQAWLNFDLAAQLVWTGGDEVFGAGKRDVAKLYEFWLYFRLEETVARVFDMDGRPSGAGGGLIQETDDGLGLTLASGKSLDWTGRYVVDGEPKLVVRFSFNRTFSGQGEDAERHSRHGSWVNYRQGRTGAWTAYMRPDYTLTLWPLGMDESQAERAEQIVHLHFDAKYRVQCADLNEGSITSVLDLFAGAALTPARAQDAAGEIADSAGLGSENAQAIEEQQAAAAAGRLSKRADLLKMHAYRDAIRRSEGAYVLYPGTLEKRWAAYHELLPGLGAFPVCPGSGVEMASVEGFLGAAADLCVDRFSQLSRQRYWTESIMAEAPVSAAGWTPPGLHQPPQDRGVVLGFMRPTAVPICVREGIFYFHAVTTDREAEQIDPRVLTARYLLPYTTDTVDGRIVTRWLGGWTEIAGIAMVHHTQLARYPGLSAALEGHGQVEYYYVATLRKDVGGAPLRPFAGEHPAPAAPPPAAPHRPRYATWQELGGAGRAQG